VKQKVVLTGSTGLIGAATIAPLLKKFDVVAVSRQLPKAMPENVGYQTLDLQDTEAVTSFFEKEMPTHLIHTAWVRSDSQGLWDNPVNKYWIDVSENLVAEFHRHGGKRAVICGTCAEYSFADTPLSEDDSVIDPNSIYGASKVELYNRLKSFADRTGLSLAWPRIFFVYGPGENEQRLVSSVIANLTTGNEMPCTHGNQVRDFTYVGDIGEGLVRLLVSSIEGAINLASGKEVALHEIICKVGDILDRSDLIKLGELPTRANEPQYIVANVEKLKQALGWLPTTDLDSGLLQTINSFRG